ncbi:NDP-hexose 2,3-dehydratase family protein [Streptomyces reniochalinae]|uniref:NDP-hexose 2,3-dehydratase n=1 Tax=Streptomyces reniochalinae TaxID=2250578 RepID=A0A367E5J6_9ACTN|nr:NDP-hexose 2,3-dehydratase family protein [Streptomyces reniochalinae]RCG13281.1 NDP-hexose 2,3-dehydratase [Streptomyces reniochalinae]
MAALDRSAVRFTASALTDLKPTALADFHRWWAERLSAGVFEVTPLAFADLNGWYFAPGSGNLVHESGKFFEVSGMRVDSGDGRQWSQPIIHQPEVGILGVLVKEIDGVLHCLLQAKMEPGNVSTLQLSPTVQATRSNYTRVHGGAQTRYLEHFRGPGRGRVLVDVLQSEQGFWCWHKQNRNMVVEATGDVPLHEDFVWLPLSQVWQLMRCENLVNMNTRTVLGCLPLARPPKALVPVEDPFRAALLRSYGPVGDEAGSEAEAEALHTLTDVVSWLTEMKTRTAWTSRLVPLDEVAGFSRTADALADDDEQNFAIVARGVRAGNREVTRWTQPLLEPRRQGLAVFVAKRVGGVVHLLVRARPEPGLLGRVEIGPTVRRPPAFDAVLSSGPEPFHSHVSCADPAQVRFDTVMSEEGGRFLHAETRYQVVEVGDDFPRDVPEDYCWLTVQQLTELVRHSHYLTVEARSLLACVHSLW